MSGVGKVFFTIGALLMVGGVYFIGAMRKPGVYPPKYILKRRATSLLLMGVSFFLLGLFIYSFR